ncbi:MAG: MltR family transcriptional regulator [Limnobacter sp.]|uniref:MltR family transcriptional regulator n=1 Tax=Limnobacter sp. TaxID=2003368 RepID=UPI00403763FA
MDEKDSDYFSDFLNEFQKESDRGAALVGAALLDSRLERILRSHFIQGKHANELLDGANAPLGTFSSRIKCCFSLGLITAHERQELEIVRSIRNLFAHQEHGLNFEDKKVQGLCSSFSPRRPQGVTCTTRQMFTYAVVANSLQLWYRPEHAEEFKCIQRAWPY